MLSEQYGSALVQVHGEAPSGEWRRMLAGLEPGQIKRALLRSRNDGRQWPPTVGQFATWAREEPQAPPYHREFVPLALPEPADVREARLARGRDHIAAMKAMLAGG